MTTAWVPLATTTLGASASSVTFTSIPATYRDLIVVINGTCSSGSQIGVQFNSNAGTNYSEVVMLGYAPGAISFTTSGNSFTQIFVGTVQSTAILQIMDYSATNKHTTTLLRNAEGGVSTNATAGRWAITDAVNTIKFDPATGGVTFDAGSTFALYGSNKL